MKAKNDALYDLDTQIETLKQQGSEQIAQYYSEMMNKQPELFLNILNGQLNEHQINKQFGLQEQGIALQKEQVEYGKTQDDYNKTMDKADRAAGAGNYNPYLELGIVTEEGKTFNENAYKDSFKPQVVSSGRSSGSNSGSNIDKNTVKVNMGLSVENALYSVGGIEKDGKNFRGYNENTVHGEYVAAEKLSDDTYTDFIIGKLGEAGYTSKEIDELMKEYRFNAAVNIAQLEGKDYTNPTVLKGIYKRKGYGWNTREIDVMFGDD